MTTILGLTPFKAALAFEIFANLSSLPSLILYPSYGASFLLSAPAQETPAALTLTRWFGGMVAALTVPLILSFPSPASGPAGDAQRGFRRATYITMGAGEVALGSLMAWAYLSGADSGISEKALVGGAVNMAVLFGMRVLFLGVKPEWVDEVFDKSKGYKGQ